MEAKILLWDHDGVLVDTEFWYFEATRRALKEWGVSLSRDKWLEGQTLGIRLDQFEFPTGPASLDYRKIRAHRDHLYAGFLSSEDVLIGDAVAVLSQLSRSHRMGLVTTTSWRVLDHIHSGGSLLDHFEHIVTADECVHLKPDPEPYLRALDQFGVPARDAVAIEDSKRGLTSAMAAGIRCVIIRSGFMEGADFEGAEAVLDTIRELPKALAT